MGNSIQNQIITLSLNNNNVANNTSSKPVISRNGEFIAFSSYATNLVTGNFQSSVSRLYLYDISHQNIQLISTNLNGDIGNGHSTAHEVSNDGQWVLFSTQSSNLDTVDTNPGLDLYLKNTITGELKLISQSSDGLSGVDDFILSISTFSLSNDGQKVVFASEASNLVNNDNNGQEDVFLWQNGSGVTLISENSTNTGTANGRSYYPSLSYDAQYVLFTSNADDIHPDYTGFRNQVYLYSLSTDTLEAVSKSSNGSSFGNQDSYYAFMTNDNRFVVFESFSSNLVDGYSFSFRRNIFIRDLESLTNTLVSGNSASSMAGNSHSYIRGFSADMRFILYTSAADNLVNGISDNNATDDLFIFDTLTGSNEVITLNTNGNETANGGVNYAFMNDVGDVIFDSDATNMGFNDNNTKTDVFHYQYAGDQNLSISFTGTGTGRINVDPLNTQCTENCGLTAPYQSEITLTATPLGGSTFEGWSGACTGFGPCAIQMNQAINISAQFDVNPDVIFSSSFE
ncbi:MAG: InlB B-repeat-containing protein [bacterium]